MTVANMKLKSAPLNLVEQKPQAHDLKEPTDVLLTKVKHITVSYTLVTSKKIKYLQKLFNFDFH